MAMARARVPWLLFLILGGSVAAMLYLRYRKGAQEVFVDAIDEVTITAKRIGSDLSATVAGWLSKVPAYMAPLFAAATAKHGLPPRLLEAVAYRESRFRPEIIDGTLRSTAGAVGVMQIIPKWHPKVGEAGAKDPQRAIPYAAQFLAYLRGRFGTWPLALAAYNWGEGNLANALAAKVPPEKWPKETRDYVAEITRNAGLA